MATIAQSIAWPPAVDRLLRDARSQEARMVQQIFGFFFVLTLLAPVAAVIIGALSLAVPTRPHHTGRTLETAVRV
jgi:hypothetical protein